MKANLVNPLNNQCELDNGVVVTPSWLFSGIKGYQERTFENECYRHGIFTTENT